jgi:hypothetical protein
MDPIVFNKDAPNAAICASLLESILELNQLVCRIFQLGRQLAKYLRILVQILNNYLIQSPFGDIQSRHYRVELSGRRIAKREGELAVQAVEQVFQFTNSQRSACACSIGASGHSSALELWTLAFKGLPVIWTFELAGA